MTRETTIELIKHDLSKLTRPSVTGFVRYLEEKAAWHKELTGVSLGSDAFFPFEDNIERAAESGVQYIAQPGGSVRDGDVIACCDDFGMAMAMTGIRLFHH